MSIFLLSHICRCMAQKANKNKRICARHIRFLYISIYYTVKIYPLLTVPTLALSISGSRVEASRSLSACSASSPPICCGYFITGSLHMSTGEVKMIGGVKCQNFVSVIRRGMFLQQSICFSNACGTVYILQHTCIFSEMRYTPEFDT